MDKDILQVEQTLDNKFVVEFYNDWYTRDVSILKSSNIFFRSSYEFVDAFVIYVVDYYYGGHVPHVSIIPLVDEMAIIIDNKEYISTDDFIMHVGKYLLSHV